MKILDLRIVCAIVAISLALTACPNPAGGSVAENPQPNTADAKSLVTVSSTQLTFSALGLMMNANSTAITYPYFISDAKNTVSLNISAKTAPQKITITLNNYQVGNYSLTGTVLFDNPGLGSASCTGALSSSGGTIKTISFDWTIPVPTANSPIGFPLPMPTGNLVINGYKYDTSTLLKG